MPRIGNHSASTMRSLSGSKMQSLGSISIGGVYSVPAYGNEWYPRMMHVEGGDHKGEEYTLPVSQKPLPPQPRNATYHGRPGTELPLWKYVIRYRVELRQD